MRLPLDSDLTSHRPLLGRLIVAYKKMVRLMVSPYLRNVFEEEHRIIESRMDERLRELSDSLRKRSDIIAADILARNNALIETLGRKLEEHVSSCGTGGHGRAIASGPAFAGGPANAFGPEGWVPEYFKGTDRVIVAGLPEADARGWTRMGEGARFDYTEWTGAVDFMNVLKGFEDNALAGIMIGEAFSRAGKDEQIGIVGLCHSRLSPGGGLVIAVPRSGEDRGADLKEFLRSGNFGDIEERAFGRGDGPLRPLPAGFRDKAPDGLVDELNRNFDMLNRLLSGGPLFIIGRK